MLELLEFLENWIKKTELKYTDLRAEGAKVGVFQFTPTFAPKARSPPASTRPSSLSCVVDIFCICTIYMYLLDVSIRDLKYFCVLFVIFVFLFMLLALLRCYTSIFDGFIKKMLQYLLLEIFDTWYVEVFYLFSMEYLSMEFLPIL